MTSNSSKGKTLRFAVASDLHVFEKPKDPKAADNDPSALAIGEDEADSVRHPIAALLKLIEDEKLRADALLCPGDLGDQASTAGIQYAWAKLVQVQKKLKAKDLFATVGNHDVDSRSVRNSHDPRGFLQTLRPNFPCSRVGEVDKFWSRHFVVIDKPDFRIVLLNSSAFHGYEGEHAHGRVSEHTLSLLREELSKKPDKTVNVLMCHHHPMMHSDRKLGDHDTMKQGKELLDMLTDDGEWFVIHGHKHDPRLSYASGTSSDTPVVFAAGSLTASLYPEIASTARNQFYIIEFPTDEIPTKGLVGTFRAWDWIYEDGFKPATKDSGLPHLGSFGHRENALTVARKAADCFGTGEDIIDWGEICEYVLLGSVETIMQNLRICICVRFVELRTHVSTSLKTS